MTQALKLKSLFSFTCISICFFVTSGFRIPDLIEEPPPKPFIDQPPIEVNQEEINRLQSIDERLKEESYELALYYILAGDLDNAKIYLEEALNSDPKFLEALLEMGFIHVWQKNYTQALIYFEDVLKLQSCEKRAIYGITEVTKHMKPKDAIQQYELLLSCDPDNVDIMFLLATAYRQTKQDQKALTIYSKLIEKDQYIDDSLEGLAIIYNRSHDLQSLEALYKKYPSHSKLKHMYARRLLNDEKYKEAKALYDNIPRTPQVYKELYEIKSRTDPSISYDANYTDAKEWDPTINIPVVKDYYFTTGFNILIPITDKGRLDMRGFEYHQRENQINTPVGVNYSVYEAGAQLKGHYYFLPKWRLDLNAKTYRAWGAQNVKYPFQNVTRFESGINLVLNSTQLFIADTHIEYFIIKNYAQGVSQLLRTDYVQGTYGYRPDIFMHPFVEGLAGAVYYHDQFNNIKNKQYLKGGFDLGTPYLKTFYLFEHSTFKYLNQNYFSYKMQTRSTVELKFQKEFASNFLCELIWDHTWELTKNLYLPIGDTVYVAQRLYLIWNIYTAKFAVRKNDYLKFELSGHYLYNTLPYWDWNLQGAITYQF
jgi:Tfp pilus assembly protein PilF